MKKVATFGKLILITLAAVTIFAGSYKYFFVHAYDAIIDIECDPTVDICFVAEEEEGTAYYKILKFAAGAEPDCDLLDAECHELLCSNSIAKCEIITCADETEFSDKFEACSE